MSHPVARFFIRRKVGDVKYKALAQHVVPLMKRWLPQRIGVQQCLNEYIRIHRFSPYITKNPSEFTHMNAFR